MRYRKLSLLLVISLVFFLVLSLILICAWFYYYFSDGKNPEVKTATIHTDTQHAKRDSLNQAYMAAVGILDSSASGESNDSLRAEFNSKLTEFYKLRNEIAVILRNRANPDDLELARQKIGTLQLKIEELRSRTSRIENENKRLNALLLQLSKDLTGQEANTRKNSATATKAVGDKPLPSPTPAFLISDIRVTAMEANGENEQETTMADKADRLMGSFIVKNNTTIQRDAELMVVVLQPDGRVLQNSSWESGTFNTREGKKIYSSKIVFDYNKGESKKLSFAIRSESFLKGNYVILIYQNGLVVGKGSGNLL